MDTQHNGILKDALKEMPELRKLRYNNRQLEMWKEKVGRMIESVYGNGSAEYRRFMNAPGKAFVVRTEMGEQQEYHRQLDCYEEVLKALIEGR